MLCRIVISLAVLVSVANTLYVPLQHQQVYETQPVDYAAPFQHQAYSVVPKIVTKTMEENDPLPVYKFSYSVDDKLTGDFKSQYEERNGDVVHGQYSLIDADGYKRIVIYTADDHNGFKAVVHREPLVHNAYISSVVAKDSVMSLLGI